MRKYFDNEEKKARLSKFLHIAAAGGWILMVPVALLTSLKSSVPFVVFMSEYALVIGHLASAAGKSAKQEAARNESSSTDNL